MKWKFLKILTVCILFIPPVVSCDPHAADYQLWIDNRSDSDLFVFYRLKWRPLDSLRINSNGKEMFCRFLDPTGSFRDDNGNFLVLFDTLGIFLATLPRKEIVKDYLNLKSWKYEQNATNITGGTDEKYTLIIINSDLRK